MKSGVIAFMGLFFLSGCLMPEPQPKLSTQTKELNSTKMNTKEISTTEMNSTQAITTDAHPVSEVLEEKEEVNVIHNVFQDELYFEKDKEGVDQHALVIKYLDARDWEKKALGKIYKRHKKLWSAKQSNSLKQIIEKNHYFGLCSDRKYWDNLAFEESEPERDVLHSMLLIRYLNNLSNGCVEWVRSKQKINDENHEEHINTKEILSLLPHHVLIEKLIMLYVSQSKQFKTLIANHHESLSFDKPQEELLAERFAIESYKRDEKNPKYQKRKQ